MVFTANALTLLNMQACPSCVPSGLNFGRSLHLFHVLCKQLAEGTKDCLVVQSNLSQKRVLFSGTSTHECSSISTSFLND